MSGNQKPRKAYRPRPVSRDPLRVAMEGASKPKKDEVDALMGTVHAAAKALREGVATLDQWAMLAGTLDVAKAIERQGVVRGLSEHLACAELALKAIYIRGDQLTGWCAPHLELDELDAVETFVDLYDFQMRQVSRTEFVAAANRAANQSLGQGAAAIVHQKERLAA